MTKPFKILKIDHIAVAVHDLNKSVELFKLLGMSYNEVENVDSEDVNVLKIHPENKEDSIELLESANDISEIKKFLDKKGEGLHHIAFKVDDIFNAITYLKEKDIKIIYDIPKKGSDNKLITFIHPKSTPGILIELCQTI